MLEAMWSAAPVGYPVRLAEKLSGRRYPGLELETWIVPEASHVRTAAPSLARALGFFAAR